MRTVALFLFILLTFHSPRKNQDLALRKREKIKRNPKPHLGLNPFLSFPPIFFFSFSHPSARPSKSSKPQPKPVVSPLGLLPPRATHRCRPPTVLCVQIPHLRTPSCTNAVSVIVAHLPSFPHPRSTRSHMDTPIIGIERKRHFQLPCRRAAPGNPAPSLYKNFAPRFDSTFTTPRTRAPPPSLTTASSRRAAVPISVRNAAAHRFPPLEPHLAFWVPLQ